MAGLLKKIGFALIVSVMLCGGISWATPVTLTWEAPTTNVDGTPLTDLGGYTLYYGLTTGDYTNPMGLLDVGNMTTATVDLALDGTVFFVVTAYDATGNESTYSNEVSYPFVLVPSAPSNLTIQ